MSSMNEFQLKIIERMGRLGFYFDPKKQEFWTVSLDNDYHECTMVAALHYELTGGCELDMSWVAALAPVGFDSSSSAAWESSLSPVTCITYFTSVEWNHAGDSSQP